MKLSVYWQSSLAMETLKKEHCILWSTHHPNAFYLRKNGEIYCPLNSFVKHVHLTLFFGKIKIRARQKNIYTKSKEIKHKKTCTINSLISAGCPNKR